MEGKVPRELGPGVQMEEVTSNTAFEREITAAPLHEKEHDEIYDLPIPEEGDALDRLLWTFFGLCCSSLSSHYGISWYHSRNDKSLDVWTA